MGFKETGGHRERPQEPPKRINRILSKVKQHKEGFFVSSSTVAAVELLKNPSLPEVMGVGTGVAVTTQAVIFGHGLIMDRYKRNQEEQELERNPNWPLNPDEHNE